VARAGGGAMSDNHIRSTLRFRPGQMPPLFGDTAAVLVVDDDSQLTDVMARLLEREGYRCTIATSPAEARSRMAERKFAVALVDVMMPGGSGLELAAQMLEQQDDLAVVMVTAVEDAGIADLALEGGAYGYVIKPFRPNEILISVANAGRRRCLEIAHRTYQARLEQHVDEQNADLDDALLHLKQTDAEAIASASEAKYQAVLNAAPDAIVGVSADGNIVLVNSQAELLFGYDREELLGHPVDILVPDAAQRVHPAHRSRYMTDPKTRPMGAGMDLAARRKDGTEFPAEISLSTIDTDDGVLVAAAIRDVSDRLEAQAERERLRAQAERERLERQLHQSQRLESLGQLAGGVAHDFNNLLAVILNYTAFIGEEVANAASAPDGQRWEVVRQDLDEVRKAAERATQLTHQLLAFGRREVVRPEVLNLNSVVVNVEQLLRRSIGEHVELVADLDPALPSIVADPGQIEQVLLNLAVNARDAMPDGGTLRIDTSNLEMTTDEEPLRPGLSPGNHVRLRVSDTGKGMDREVVARAFEPFFTTKAKGEGSGLGLATVYGIITQAGGHAQIYSEPGLGTTFTALFPATDQDVQPRERAAVQLHLRGGETVLVVEDEDAMREVTRRILARNGYKVLAASRGEEAITIAQQPDLSIDLLLTDVVMPQMLGKEVAERVRQIQPAVRVLYMSGYAQPVLASRGTLAEGVILVEKPFNEAGLLSKVKEALES